MKVNFRNRLFSGHIHISDLKVNGGLLLALLLLVIASLSLGVKNLNPIETFMQLIAPTDQLKHLVIYELRMPRMLMAVFAGSLLALAGLLLQNLTKVDIASPSLLGTVDGAGFAVALYLIFATSVLDQSINTPFLLPLSAFVGALSVMLILGLLMRRRPAVMTLVLIGIGLGALFKAGTTAALLNGPTYAVTQLQVWLIGRVNQANWQEINILIPVAVSLVLSTLFCARLLKISDLGIENRASLGASNSRLFILFAILSAGLTATAVAFVGAVSFIGLVAPHLARKVVASRGVNLICCTALIGATLLLAADTIGRTVFYPYEVPAGVFTAILGIPFFIHLFIIKGRS